MFWREDSGRQLQLITPENEGGDETSSPSWRKFTFVDDPDVPLGPRSRGPPEPPRGLPEPPRGLPDLPGLPSGLSPVPPPAGEGERVRAGNALRGRSRPRSPLPEPQLTPIPMSDSDVDQPLPEWEATATLQILTHKRHKYHPQVPQTQPIVIQEPVTVPDEDSTVVTPSSPSTGLSPSEDRVSAQLNEHLHIAASSPNLLHLLLESTRSSLWPVKVRMRNQQPWNHRAA